VIVLDTHIWIWWAHDPDRLSHSQLQTIQEHETDILGISAISVWEIAVESTRLPGEFHRDPADQIIVATARVHNVPLVSSDRKIIAYPHVVTIP
jgi:PIN domain nuclease of toxin-antitoxin system